MGLDQYAHRVTKRGQQLRKAMLCLPTSEERRTFSKENHISDEVHEIKYWRKHANLNEWMSQLALKKGVVKNDIDFNCVDLILEPADIDALEKDITQDALPHGEGFFWGKSTFEDRMDDEDFIIKARQAFAAGEAVIYSCWW